MQGALYAPFASGFAPAGGIVRRMHSTLATINASSSGGTRQRTLLQRSVKPNRWFLDFASLYPGYAGYQCAQEMLTRKFTSQSEFDAAETRYQKALAAVAGKLIRP